MVGSFHLQLEPNWLPSFTLLWRKLTGRENKEPKSINRERQTTGKAKRSKREKGRDREWEQECPPGSCAKTQKRLWEHLVELEKRTDCKSQTESVNQHTDRSVLHKHTKADTRRFWIHFKEKENAADVLFASALQPACRELWYFNHSES